MDFFLSSFINKVDAKGRVSVPVQFRNVIAKTGSEFNGIVIYQSFINDCVEACTMKQIQKFANNIDDLDPFSENRDVFATAILSGSVQLPFDADGRIIIPSEFLTLADIKDNACFVGKGSNFEIWNPEKFNEHSLKARELAKQNRSLLINSKQKNKESE